VLQLSPGRTEAEWAALAPAERKAAKVRFRVGSGDTASLETLRIVIHRPLPGDGDRIMMQVTATWKEVRLCNLTRPIRHHRARRYTPVAENRDCNKRGKSVDNVLFSKRPGFTVV
jgi:hypothetical protein